MHVTLEAMTSWARAAGGEVPPPLVGPSTTLVTVTHPSSSNSAPAATSTKIYLFGGRSAHNRELSNDLWVLDLDPEPLARAGARMDESGRAGEDGADGDGHGDGRMNWVRVPRPDERANTETSARGGAKGELDRRREEQRDDGSIELDDRKRVGPGSGEGSSEVLPEDRWPTARYFHSADVWNNKIVIFGGMGSVSLDPPSPPTPPLQKTPAGLSSISPLQVTSLHSAYVANDSISSSSSSQRSPGSNLYRTQLDVSSSSIGINTPPLAGSTGPSHANANVRTRTPNEQTPVETAIVLDDVWLFDCVTMSWEKGQRAARGVEDDGAVGAEEARWRPLARYAHLSSVIEGRLVVSGGQDIRNEYITQSAIFDLDSREWVGRQTDISSLRGSYKSLAVSSTLKVVPQLAVQGLQRLPLSVRPASGETEMITFTNSNFTDVKRELSSTKLVVVDGVPKLVETDLTLRMTGLLLPPGLRFPFGAILGNTLLLAGTFLSATVQSYALWCMDLTTYQWTRLGATLLEGKGALSRPEFGRPESWNRALLWGDRNRLLVLGNRTNNLQEDYDHRAVNFDHVGIVDLEIFGVYQPPMTPKVVPHMQPMALNSLKEGWHCDFAMVCEDGRAIRCSRRILIERWPWFAKENAAFLTKSMALVADAVSRRQQTHGTLDQEDLMEGMGDALPVGLSDTRINARQVFMPEPYPVCMALLQYLYTEGLVTPLQHRPPILSGLLMVAKQYDMPELCRLVCHAMHTQLSDESALAVYEIATLCGCTSLQVRALRRVLEQQRQSARNAAHKRGPSNGGVADGRNGGGPSATPHSAAPSSMAGPNTSRGANFSLTPGPGNRVGNRTGLAMNLAADTTSPSPVKDQVSPSSCDSAVSQPEPSSATSIKTSSSEPLIPPTRTKSKEALRYSPSMQDISEATASIPIGQRQLRDPRHMRKRSASSISVHHQALPDSVSSEVSRSRTTLPLLEVRPTDSSRSPAPVSPPTFPHSQDIPNLDKVALLTASLPDVPSRRIQPEFSTRSGESQPFQRFPMGYSRGQAILPNVVSVARDPSHPPPSMKVGSKGSDRTPVTGDLTNSFTWPNTIRRVQSDLNLNVNNERELAKERRHVAVPPRERPDSDMSGSALSVEGLFAYFDADGAASRLSGVRERKRTVSGDLRALQGHGVERGPSPRFMMETQPQRPGRPQRSGSVSQQQQYQRHQQHQQQCKPPLEIDTGVIQSRYDMRKSPAAVQPPRHDSSTTDSAGDTISSIPSDSDFAFMSRNSGGQHTSVEYSAGSSGRYALSPPSMSGRTEMSTATSAGSPSTRESVSSGPTVTRSNSKGTSWSDELDGGSSTKSKRGRRGWRIGGIRRKSGKSGGSADGGSIADGDVPAVPKVPSPAKKKVESKAGKIMLMGGGGMAFL